MSNLRIPPRIWSNNTQSTPIPTYASSRPTVQTGLGLEPHKAYYHRVNDNMEGEEVGPYTARRPTAGISYTTRTPDLSPLNPTLRPPPSSYNRERERKSERPYASSTQLGPPISRPYVPYQSQASIENMVPHMPSADPQPQRPARPSQRIKLDGTVVENSPSVSGTIEQQRQSQNPASMVNPDNISTQPAVSAYSAGSAIRYERKSEQIGVYPTQSQAQWLQQRTSNTSTHPPPQSQLTKTYSQALSKPNSTYQVTYTSQNGVDGRFQNTTSDTRTNYPNYMQQKSWEHTREGYKGVEDGRHQTQTNHSSSFTEYTSRVQNQDGYNSQPTALYNVPTQQGKAACSSPNIGAAERAPQNTQAKQYATSTLPLERKSQNIDESRTVYLPSSGLQYAAKQAVSAVEGFYQPAVGGPSSRPQPELCKTEQPKRPERKSNYDDFDSDDELEHPPSVPPSLKANNPVPKHPNPRARPGRPTLKDANSSYNAKKTVVFDSKEAVAVFDPYIVPKKKNFVTQAPRKAAPTASAQELNTRLVGVGTSEVARNSRTISRSVDPSPNANRTSITQHNNPRSVNPAPPGRMARGSERPATTYPIAVASYR